MYTEALAKCQWTFETSISLLSFSFSKCIIMSQKWLHLMRGTPFHVWAVRLYFFSRYYSLVPRGLFQHASKRAYLADWVKSILGFFSPASLWVALKPPPPPQQACLINNSISVFNYISLASLWFFLSRSLHSTWTFTPSSWKERKGKDGRPCQGEGMNPRMERI